MLLHFIFQNDVLAQFFDFRQTETRLLNQKLIPSASERMISKILRPSSESLCDFDAFA